MPVGISISRGLALAGLIAIGTAASAVPSAAGQVDEVAVIAHGKVNGFGWSVEAAPEGRSICFEVAVFKPKTPNGGDGVGQCSGPARRRGILHVVPNEHKRGAPKVVAVGGAFNRDVAGVRVVDFNGHVHHLHLHYLNEVAAESSLRKYQYTGFAVAGPWCARTVTTYDKHGHKLWETEWRLFDTFGGVSLDQTRQSCVHTEAA
ncbi:MAG: hypothetical protein ACTHK6_03605 [Solirubrobacterales bacterium]